MYRLIVHREPLDSGDFVQDMQRFDLRLMSYVLGQKFPAMPLLSMDDDGEDLYLYWEFPSEDDAAIFKLTHM